MPESHIEKRADAATGSDSSDSSESSDSSDSSDEEQNSELVDPLTPAIKAWHNALPAHHMMHVHAGNTALEGRTIHIGTGFSGCDIAWAVLKRLQRFWSQTFEIQLDFELTFSCESDEEKMRWLMTQHSEAQRLFRDMAELGGTRAYCLKAKARELVPPVDIFLAGFVCTSRSPLNRFFARITLVS